MQTFRFPCLLGLLEEMPSDAASCYYSAVRSLAMGRVPAKVPGQKFSRVRFLDSGDMLLTIGKTKLRFGLLDSGSPAMPRFHDLFSVRVFAKGQKTHHMPSEFAPSHISGGSSSSTCSSSSVRCLSIL